MAEQKQETNNRLKVCFLSTIRIPTSRLVTRQCAAVAKSGASVTLIAPLRLQAECSDIKLRYFPCAKGAIGRLISSPLALAAALRERADVYHVHSLPLIFCAIILKLLFQKRVVYDIYEDFPSMMLMKRSLPYQVKNMLSRGIFLAESVACRMLDAIVSADPAVLRMYATNRNRTDEGAARRVFYNFPAQWFLAAGESERLRVPKQYDIVYSGGMSERTGMIVLLEAVMLMVRRGLNPKVLMFGYADEPAFLASFKTMADDRGVAGCFEILGRARPFDMPPMLCRARVGVVPFQPIPKFLKNIPTKMFEYWACGLPVVASDLPTTRLFLRNGEFGYLVKPNDPAGFADALERLLLDPPSLERMGANARNAVKRRLNAASEEARLLRLYATIVKPEAQSKAGVSTTFAS